MLSLRAFLCNFAGAAVACSMFVDGAASAAPVEPSKEQVEFFESKVRPVLVRHCYECHSAEGRKAKGGLRLDTRDALLKGGDTGPAIVPGQPEKSLLISAVRHAEDDLRMPKQKLAPHEIDGLTEWVRIGAPDPRTGDAAAAAPATSAASRFDWEKERQHWAYRPVKDVDPPVVKDRDWPAGDIDRFILAQLEGRGLSPVADADPRTLIRRMTFDLTGLPPEPPQVEAFVRDWQSDAPSALRALVDRLLDSPAYGERWGRHWMDVVRYADTAGDNSDYPIPQAYLYRNYVIDAFNKDKPYDRFVREQLAGDLLAAADQDQRNEQVIATGYLAMSRRFGSVVDRYPQHLTIEDTLDNLGKTFLGLGLSCARCHDHKFDAITQKDYYALYGVFESTRYAFPGIELLKIQKDFVPLLSPEELERALGPNLVKERELQKAHDDLAAKRKAMEGRRAELEKAIAAAGKEKEKLAEDAKRLHQEIERVRAQIKTAAQAIETQQKKRPRVRDAYAVQDGTPGDARVHLKGDPEKLGEAVPRRWLELFGAPPVPSEVSAKGSGRLQLADWLADPKNPLTARVMVNRVWHYHFGSGLVETPNDFGVRGRSPSHPELLDWLAARFAGEDGWSVKKLHRRILLSRAYRLASDDDERNLAADPDNDLHWRYSRRRLDAESLRDTLLAVAGNLDRTPMTEPHPFPPIEKWDFTQHHPFRADYPTARRSVYQVTSRLTAAPFFQTFDGPDRNASTPVRDSSVTTVQALYWLNDAFLHEQADRFAARVLKESPDEDGRLSLAFGLALQRAPTPEEQAQSVSYLTQVRERVGGSSAADGDRRAWASFARALFRTNEFLYVD